MEGARIGRNCNIFPGSVISAVPQDLKFDGEESFVEIGDKLRAIESYKKSILIDPEFSFPMYYRLAITEHSIGFYSESLEHIQKYLNYKRISSNYRKKSLSLKKSCEFSIDAMKSPVTFNPVNLGINVNSNADEYLPALSADGSTLIFTRSENVKGVRNEDFYISYNDTDEWQFANNLGEPINTLKNEGLDAFWRLLAMKKDSSNASQHLSSLNSIPDPVVSTLLNYRKKLKELTKNCINYIPNEAWQSSMIEVEQSVEILKLFKFIDNLLILCPQRYGPWGVKKIHEFLLGKRFEKEVEKWEEGTPIMAKSNQPEIGLANGDVGIIIGNGEKRRFLFNVFSEEQRLVTRLINPSRLNIFDAAYAMTIHKAQGSEADQVLLLWPSTSKVSEDNTLIKFYSDDYEKRMLYTAITRAKKQLLVITNKEEDF